MLVGTQVIIGWNAAKKLGDTFYSSSTLRLECEGIDWLVFRADNNRALSIDFPDYEEKQKFIDNIET